MLAHQDSMPEAHKPLISQQTQSLYLERRLSIVMNWRDIMTDCKRSDSVSKQVIVLPSRGFLGFKGRGCVDVSHWSSVFRAHFEENRLDFLEVFFCVLLFVDDEFLEDHVVLSERACLISEDVRDSP